MLAHIGRMLQLVHGIHLFRERFQPEVLHNLQQQAGRLAGIIGAGNKALEIIGILFF